MPSACIAPLYVNYTLFTHSAVQKRDEKERDKKRNVEEKENENKTKNNKIIKKNK
jgi:hypothetical protein